jgi:hypothetical protein
MNHIPADRLSDSIPQSRMNPQPAPNWPLTTPVKPPRCAANAFTGFYRRQDGPRSRPQRATLGIGYEDVWTGPIGGCASRQSQPRLPEPQTQPSNGGILSANGTDGQVSTGLGGQTNRKNNPTNCRAGLPRFLHRGAPPTVLIRCSCAPSGSGRRPSLWSATRFTTGQAERQDEKHLECADWSALCRFPADGGASVPACGRCRLEGHAPSWPRSCRAGWPAPETFRARHGPTSGRNERHGEKVAGGRAVASVHGVGAGPHSGDSRTGWLGGGGGVLPEDRQEMVGLVIRPNQTSSQEPGAESQSDSNDRGHPEIRGAGGALEVKGRFTTSLLESAQRRPGPTHGTRRVLQEP